MDSVQSKFGTRKCQQCGNDFQLKNNQQVETRKFCSQKCSGRWRWEHGHSEKLVWWRASEEARKRNAEGVRQYYKTHKHPKTGTVTSDDTKKKISDALKKVHAQNPEIIPKGPKNKKWKKRNVDSHGYAYVQSNDDTSSKSYSGKKREHVVVAEVILGRRLLTGEIVHHINRDKSDNDKTNLAVMTQSEHMKMHGLKLTRPEFEGQFPSWIFLGDL